MWLHYPTNFSKLGAPTPSKLLIGFVAKTAWGSGVCQSPERFAAAKRALQHQRHLQTNELLLSAPWVAPYP